MRWVNTRYQSWALVSDSDEILDRVIGLVADDGFQVQSTGKQFITLDAAKRHAEANYTMLMFETSAPNFPTTLRKMWSGGEVQQWINENWKMK